MITNRPQLSPKERKLPLAKYYNLPLHELGPLYRQIIDAGPLDPEKDALSIDRWLEHLQLPDVYQRKSFGYCQMEDGSGYIAQYAYYPNCTQTMMKWYLNWINTPSKSQPEGTGNIRYKIWCPADHFTHGFVNGKDSRNGVFTIESQDLNYGASEHGLGNMSYSVLSPVNLRELGLTEQVEKTLKSAGVTIDAATIKNRTLQEPHTPIPGSTFSVSISRPHSSGGMEKLTLSWPGYGLIEGNIRRDKDTPAYKLSNDRLKLVLIHNTVEAQHLSTFLPQLYAEYKDKPIDAD